MILEVDTAGYGAALELAQLPNVPTIQQIEELEDYLKKGETLELKAEHHFSEGIYARTLFIPKGTILTGKAHRQEHLNIISQGLITVWTEQGMKKVGAGTHIVSQPGCKRVGYAHEDTIWTTIHSNPANEKDPEKLELTYIIPRNNQLRGQSCLG